MFLQTCFAFNSPLEMSHINQFVSQIWTKHKVNGTIVAGDTKNMEANYENIVESSQ